MGEDYEPVTATSCHLRCEDRDAVLRALGSLTGTGSPIQVWPPRPLPAGILISPPRYGWISLWGLRTDYEELVEPLSATLECTGVVFSLLAGDHWLMQLFQDGRRIALLSSPAEAADERLALERAWGELQQEGIADPSEAEAQLRARAQAIALSSEFRQERGMHQGDQEVLASLLPAGRSLAEALHLARVWDAVPEEGPNFVEDVLETFANYLGIRDAAWDAGPDEETLCGGDYEDAEGLPQGWEEFVLAPLARWELAVAE